MIMRKQSFKTILTAVRMYAAPLMISAVVMTSPALAQKVWRHGIVEAKSDAGFVLMAQKGGFAQKRGLTLDIVQFKGDALALKAMIAGELDSYEGSPGGPMLAVIKGADIKLVGCYWPGLTYAIFTKADVASVKELKGKTFGISSPGALPDLFARSVLEANNISADDVQFAAMGSDTDRFRAVSAGIIGAAAASTEFTPMITQMGLKVLVHAHDVTPNYVRFCTYMSGQTIKARTADVTAFLAASIESYRYAMGHRDETIKLAKEAINAKEDDARQSYVFDEVVRYNAIDPEMNIPRDKLTWMQDLFIKTGTLTGPVNFDTFIDPAPRQKALDLISAAK
jgi:NitT/TauT family transport system substrate-binding protein